MNLSRFINAHQRDFDLALSEVRAGRKYNHWMWYIFPQIYGLGYSATAQHYAIKSLDEAKAYLADPYLCANMNKICDALLSLETNDAFSIFGSPDNMKLRSSMTLFSLASEGENIFDKVLEKYFHGEKDMRTMQILKLI